MVVKEIESFELATLLDSGEGVQLLDIRSDAEVAQGVLPGAVHVPMHLLPARISEYPSDRDLVLYCRSGARSYHACAYLTQHGIGNVVNLRGGIMAWMRHGLPIALPPGRSTGI